MEYKQQLYRDLATQLRNLQTNFFSYSNPTTNLLSDAFFSKMTAATESKYFHATATSNAATGTSTVDYITQLAKAAKKTGTKKASGELRSSHKSADDLVKKIKAFDENLKAEVKFSVDGTGGSKEKTLTAADLKQLAGKSNDEAAKILTDLLKADTGITVKNVNGKLTFNTNGADQTLMINTDSVGQALLGLGSTSVKGSGSYSTKIDTRQLMPGFQVQLDGGERKTIYLDLPDGIDATNAKDKLYEAVKNGLQKTFGDAILVEQDPTTGEMMFSTKDTSRSFTITGTSGVMDILGIKSGQSNKMTTGMRLDQINFAEKLDGNDFIFSINDVEFHVTGDTTLTDLMLQINNSDAGVKLTYNENTDKFSLESTVSGAGSQINIEQKQGNLLTALFGNIKGNTSVAGKTLTTSQTVTSANNTVLNSSGGKVQFDIITADGRRRSISVSVSPDEKKDGKTFTRKDSIVAAINSALAENEEAEMAGGIRFSIEDDGRITINADGRGTTIITKAGPGTVMSQLGFTNGQNNIATEETKLSEVDGFDVSALNFAGLDGDSTIKDLQKAMEDAGYNAEWDANEGRFIMNSTTPGTIDLTGTGLGALFGGKDKLTFEAQTEKLNSVEGQNARLSINGNEIERSSNDFTYAGVTYSLAQTFDGRKKDANDNFLLADGDFSIDKDGYYRDKNNHYVIKDGDAYQYVDKDGNLYNEDGTATGSSISASDVLSKAMMKDGTEIYAYDERAGEVDVTRDTDQIYDGIVKFVDEYNKVMEKIHSLLVEDPDYKDYLPLTDEQKSEMSDREIELWEEKAKTGLLRGDSALNSIWDDLRSTIYAKPSGSDIGIYNIGITTSTSTEYGGQLVIDHSKLKEMINSDPEAVRKLFTDSVDGVSTSLNNAINRAARSSSANPGRLVALAGSSKSDTSSSLYKQMKAIDDNLTTLQDRYDSEYQRYWSQFNAMEQYIQQMNQQASWLTQQLGG